MRAFERLISYSQFETASDEKSTAYPSTESQREFALALAEELKTVGVQDIQVDKYSYVTGTIPSNMPVEGTVIGFIAHMDTVRETEYRNVKPRIVEQYDGGEVVLNAEKGITLSPDRFPVLNECVGKTLIVTDGITLLGSDDKAGIAEIVTMAEILLHDSSIKHGKIRLAFTPDEEIGRGVDYFDVSAFGASYAYTVDGGAFGEVEYETFNAASADIEIHGVSAHTGAAKGTMVNAIMLASEFLAMLPENERPETTEGYQGFFHANELTGTVEKATIHYLLRDHDESKLEKRKEFIQAICQAMNQKYGENTVTVTIKDSYKNMRSKIEAHMHLIDTASEAVRILGGTVKCLPVRGGTDGCRLSYMGLPCPNLGTGSYNAHSRFEFSVAEDMDKVVEQMIHIAKAYAEK